LLGVIAFITALQVAHLPWWCLAMSAGVLCWRAWLAARQQALPGTVWRLALLASAVGATWWTHRTLLGQEAGVTLIAVLIALKTLELRARRDAFVVFFLGFFVLLTRFFHAQSLWTALGTLLALWGLLTALVNAHLPVGHPPLWRAARQAGGLVLAGAPVMLVLFVLFPRVGPLWGVPGDGSTGRSGLSNQVEVGQVARLALDDSVAFRLRFDGATPPADQLYFRGPVLSVFDGRTWSPRPRVVTPALRVPTQLRVEGPPVSYEVTLEPSHRPWLFVMDATEAPPDLPSQELRMGPDLQWLTRQPVTDTLRYRASSHPRFQHGPTQAVLGLQEDVALPPSRNPRTLQWAQDLLRGAGAGAQTHHQRLALALRALQTGGYVYTLEPGPYGDDTADTFWFDRKAGFCEHIASAFVVLLRAMDVPARMVTGYQGGERNPVDGLWTVRQSDAHAWTEVWLPGEGWTRVDPTAQVAPARFTALQRLRATPGPITSAMLNLSPGLWSQLQHGWEALNHGWTQWVLNYTQGRQMDLLKQLGWSSPEGTDLLTALSVVLATAAVAGLLWARQPWRRPDPWHHLLGRAVRQLEAAGHRCPPHPTPRQLAKLLPNGSGAHRWLIALEAQRYDPQHTDDLRHLARAFPDLTWPPPPAPHATAP
jgi:transglutaminase-like putative cysteine protease